MSAAIGGRSESIGAAPDRSVAQTTQQIKADTVGVTEEEKIALENLTQEELDALTGNDAAGKQLPFGAVLTNLFARKKFRTGLANKFLSAPDGSNVDRKQAEARITQLDQVIADAKQAQAQNSADEAAAGKVAKIFAGSPLDIAFSNKRRSINNIIQQAEAEKRGIALQTDTEERKRVFGDFTVVTDKKGGKGLRRGVFNTAGRGALTKEQAEFIRKQQFKTADTETALQNLDEIQSAGKRTAGFIAAHDRMSRAVKRRFSSTAQTIEQQGVDAQGKETDFGEKLQFTDQLLVPNRDKITRIASPELAEANAPRIQQIDAEIAALEQRRANASSILGAPLSLQSKLQGRRTNSRGTSPLEREQFHRGISFKLSGLKREREQLTTIAENPLVKQDELSISSVNSRRQNRFNTRQRKASLFEAIQTLARIQGLPQNNGDRGANTQGKANLGALKKVQGQRIREQKQETSRLQIKKDFDTKLAEIQSNGELNQKEKQAAIFKAARERDEGLKGKTVTNTQFEQSRAGFAASRTNIVSGHTVRSVQDFIDLGRKKRRINL